MKQLLFEAQHVSSLALLTQILSQITTAKIRFSTRCDLLSSGLQSFLFIQSVSTTIYSVNLVYLNLSDDDTQFSDEKSG